MDVQSKWICYLVACLHIVGVNSLDSRSEADITLIANQYRGVVFPMAKHMPCLTWSTTLLSKVQELASTCTIPDPTDTSIIFNAVEPDPADGYLDIFGEWLAQNADYTFDTNTCADGKSCNEFKTLFNDLANQFACAQGSCKQLVNLAAPTTAYTYTVCQFDQQRPTGVPYEQSGSDQTSCTTETCVAAGKTTCTDGLCCGAGTPSTCIDTLVGETCTQTLCDQNPGTYLTKCRKTCNNCDGCLCNDATNFDCAKWQSYLYCTKYPKRMQGVCPKTCNTCVKAKTCARKSFRTSTP